MKELYPNTINNRRLIIKYLHKFPMGMFFIATFGFGQHPVLFTEHVISTSADGARSVYVEDVNGDGNMDVLSASFNDSKIAWFENDGNENFTEHIISTSLYGACSVYAVDMDSDGDIDVLSASLSDNKIVWYENEGSEVFTEHVIANLVYYAISVHAADVDGDGDMDVLSASNYDHEIAWYENDGSESFSEHVISNTAIGAWSVYAADVDGDGNMDVLSASSDDNKIAWYENDGSESFITHVISTSAIGTWSVHAADMDSDGNMDVLSASLNDDKIAWYDNDGSEAFTEHVISSSANGARSVYAADVDGDGDVDVVSASRDDNKIAWYENERHLLEAPSGFALYPQETYVSLTWSPISDDDFQYYILERSTDSVFTENVVSNELVINFYEDDSLEYDTEYFYRVYYYTGEHQSEYSEALSVTLEWMEIDVDQLPKVYAFHQNYPNPFNPITTLRYDLPGDAMVNITIYDMLGKLVSNLVNTNQLSGFKSIQWDATNNQGQPVSAGVYLYSIKAGEFMQTKKMILLK